MFTLQRYHQQINANDIISFISHIQMTEFGITLSEKDCEPLNTIATYFTGLSHDGANFWVALFGQNIVGTIGLKHLSHHAVEIKRFFVDQHFRGKGVGQELLDAAITQAQAEGKENIYLGTGSAKERAIAFYKKNNFIEISKCLLPAEYCLDALDDRFFRLSLR